MYNNISNSDTFPKTLEIRNTAGGMIWQIYHVNNLNEAELLSKGANSNGFQDRQLVDFRKEEETFPDWRTNCNSELEAVLT